MVLAIEKRDGLLVFGIQKLRGFIDREGAVIQTGVNRSVSFKIAFIPVMLIP